MRNGRSGLIAAVAALAASGCDGAPERDPPAPIEVGDGGSRARIESLAPGQRDAVFLRAVRDAGQSCQGVAGSAYSGVHFGMPAWVARCSDGRDWLIMLDRGGGARVARREEAGGNQPPRRAFEGSGTPKGRP